MAAQSGRLFLLQLGSGSPVTYASLASCRETSMTINHEVVDVTAKDTNGWRDLLANDRMHSMSISISGVFKDATVENDFSQMGFDGDAGQFKLIAGNGDAWTGQFVIASYERGGAYNGEETFSATLENAGVVTFTPGV